MDDMARVTSHAGDRIRERIKLPKRATDRTALLALERGLPVECFTGTMRKYLDKVTRTTNHQGKQAIIRIHANNVYIFSEGDPPILITMWPVPKKFSGANRKKYETERNWKGELI